MKYEMKKKLSIITCILLAVLTSCTQTGTFHIIGGETEDPSVTVREKQKALAEVLGKEVTIERYGKNLKVSVEDEPDVFVFAFDTKNSNVVNYKAEVPNGYITLQYRIAVGLLPDYTVTGGRIYTTKSGYLYSVDFER